MVHFRFTQQKFIAILLSIFIFRTSGLCNEIEIKAGTKIFFRATTPIVFKELYEGKEITFEITRKVMVGDFEVLKVGDSFKGVVIGGIQRLLLGIPERVLIQFSVIDTGKTQLPIMKAKEWRGSGRSGLVYGLFFPTFALSLFIPGGKLKKTQEEVMVTMVASVKVNN